VRILSDFVNFLQIRNPMDFRLIRIQLSFWKAHVHHSSQSAVSHIKVNKCTLNCGAISHVAVLLIIELVPPSEEEEE